MLIIQHLGYIHPNGDILFSDINIVVSGSDKVALVGNNGSGKSTLLRIIAGSLSPQEGSVVTSAEPYLVPQHFGQFDRCTIAGALGIEKKLLALRSILDGDVSEEHMLALNDDWTIEERAEAALLSWGLEGLGLAHSMSMLSGGQKTKIFLAGILIHQPDIILMDEPTNHLDSVARTKLYEFVQKTNSSLMVVSHDRQLLNLLHTTYELSSDGITLYGGNYDFYVDQKHIESVALNEHIKVQEKTLRKAKEAQRTAAERKNKLDARARKKEDKAGMPAILLHSMKNSAEQSTAKLKDAHNEKVNLASERLAVLRDKFPDIDKMKFGFGQSAIDHNKILLAAQGLNFGYSGRLLWNRDLSLEIRNGERIAIEGVNGSGKTTLVQLLTGSLSPAKGSVSRATGNIVYLDQDYTIINNANSVYDQAQQYNASGLEEHEIKIRLTRFLFTKDDWDKPCSALSGGERMKLMLCCFTISERPVDLLILDEPTNNLDIQNVDVLTAAVNAYNGTLLAISHDAVFLKDINIERTISLDYSGVL